MFGLGTIDYELFTSPRKCQLLSINYVYAATDKGNISMSIQLVNIIIIIFVIIIIIIIIINLCVVVVVVEVVLLYYYYNHYHYYWYKLYLI